MKFTTQLSNFQKLLQRVMPAVAPRATFEALEYISLSLEGNELIAIASDNEITIKSKTTVEGNGNGEILIPAKKINEIVKVLDSTKDMHFECKDDFIIKITSGKGKFQINGMNPEEYVELPKLLATDPPSIEKKKGKNTSIAFFKREIIQKLAAQTYFAVSQDEYRLNMSGVLFQFRKSYVNVVATDSFRLVRSTAFADEHEYPNEVDILVPARAVEICKKIDENLIMSLDAEQENHSLLRMDFGDTTIVTRLINENFPKYEAIIPVSSNCQATFDVSELLNAVKRVAPIANEKQKKCKLEFFEDKLKVISENEDTSEEATEEIPAELLDADTFAATFNIKYLEEVMQNISPDDTTNNLVSMFFVSADRAALVKPKADQESLIMILMPIRMA
jgi:DNA polymerase-3 subunit beta